MVGPAVESAVELDERLEVLPALERREPVAIDPDQLGRHALADLGLVPAVGQDHQAAVAVQVDEPGSDDLAGRVDRVRPTWSRGRVSVASRSAQPAVDDRDRPGSARCAGAVDHGPAGDQQVGVLGHGAAAGPWPIVDVALHLRTLADDRRHPRGAAPVVGSRMMLDAPPPRAGAASAPTTPDRGPRAASAGVVLLYLARSMTFWQDEWGSIAFNGGRLDIIRPVNEHWSTIPLLLYRATFALVGLHSYLPYIAEVIALHLVAVAAAFVLIRRRVDGSSRHSRASRCSSSAAGRRTCSGRSRPGSSVRSRSGCGARSCSSDPGAPRGRRRDPAAAGVHDVREWACSSWSRRSAGRCSIPPSGGGSSPSCRPPSSTASGT